MSFITSSSVGFEPKEQYSVGSARFVGRSVNIVYTVLLGPTLNKKSPFFYLLDVLFVSAPLPSACTFEQLYDYFTWLCSNHVWSSILVSDTSIRILQCAWFAVFAHGSLLHPHWSCPRTRSISTRRSQHILLVFSLCRICF